MNGIETIAKIRENFYASKEEQPIILLSSSSDDENLTKKIESLQINQRLIKHVKMQEIYTALSRLHQKKNVAETTAPTDASIVKTGAEFDLLIAEDNPVNMLLATTILKRILPNARIIEVKNGLEAVKYCEKQLPDLILMNVQIDAGNEWI